VSYTKSLQKSKQHKSDEQQEISLQVERYVYVDAFRKIGKILKMKINEKQESNILLIEFNVSLSYFRYKTFKYEVISFSLLRNSLKKKHKTNEINY